MHRFMNNYSIMVGRWELRIWRHFPWKIELIRWPRFKP
jgi:hypothetical protein